MFEHILNISAASLILDLLLGLVLAIDGRHPVRTLDDVNNDALTFTHTTYFYRIQENEPAGSIIGKVSARDEDLRPNNAIRYYLVHENSAKTDRFSIDSHSGKLSSRVRLDREEQSMYRLTLAATDHGTPPLTGTASLVIVVTDVNDNAPVFEYPSPTRNLVQVSNSAPVGHVITRLKAKDADSDKNGMIVYRLLQTDKTDFFAVDPYLGTVSVTRDLSAIDLQTFHLVVQAEDLGHPPHSAVASLRVVVTNTESFIPPSEGQQEMLERWSPPSTMT